MSMRSWSLFLHSGCRRTLLSCNASIRHDISGWWQRTRRKLKDVEENHTSDRLPSPQQIHTEASKLCLHWWHASNRMTVTSIYCSCCLCCGWSRPLLGGWGTPRPLMWETSNNTVATNWKYVLGCLGLLLTLFKSYAREFLSTMQNSRGTPQTSITPLMFTQNVEVQQRRNRASLKGTDKETELCSR